MTALPIAAIGLLGWRSFEDAGKVGIRHCRASWHRTPLQTAAPGNRLRGTDGSEQKFTSELRTAFTEGSRSHLVNLPNALMHTSLESLLRMAESITAASARSRPPRRIRGRLETSPRTLPGPYRSFITRTALSTTSKKSVPISPAGAMETCPVPSSPATRSKGGNLRQNPSFR